MRRVQFLPLMVVVASACWGQTAEAQSARLCGPGELEITHDGGGALGSTYLIIKLRNQSRSRCVVSGEPVVEVFSARGKWEAPQVNWMESLNAIGAGEHSLTLPPGSGAQFVVQTSGDPSQPFGERCFESLRVALRKMKTPILQVHQRGCGAVNMSGFVPLP